MEESDQIQNTQRGQNWAELGGVPQLHPRGSPPLLLKVRCLGHLALSPLRNLLKMQNPRPHPTPTLYPILRMGKLRHIAVKKLA